MKTNQENILPDGINSKIIKYCGQFLEGLLMMVLNRSINKATG